jgi:cytoskeletal protein CcmA (bactofilin family)
VKGTVHIADGAQVDARVQAAFVVVAGEFKGRLQCDEKVELLPRSRLTGEVITKILSVQEGATMDGQVQMSGEANVQRVTKARSPRVKDDDTPSQFDASSPLVDAVADEEGIRESVGEGTSSTIELDLNRIRQNQEA